MSILKELNLFRYKTTCPNVTHPRKIWTNEKNLTKEKYYKSLPPVPFKTH